MASADPPGTRAEDPLCWACRLSLPGALGKGPLASGSPTRAPSSAFRVGTARGGSCTLPVSTSAREQAGARGAPARPTFCADVPGRGLACWGLRRPGRGDSRAVAGLGGRAPSALLQALLPLVLLQAAERDNQNLEDKVRSLKTDIEESKYRQRHLKVEVKSFLEVLDGKIDDLHDFRRGLSKLAADN